MVRPSRPTVIALSVVAAAIVAVVAVTVVESSGSGAVPQTRSSRSGPARVLPSAAAAADGLPRVGPLFPSGLDSDHTCTASVVASSSGDTILTAAHCLSGSVRGMLFAPGYRSGSTPYGVWTVESAYVTSRWLARQTPADDFAVLTVADRVVGGRRVTLASVTGSERVGDTPAAGTPVTVQAYNSGRDDDPQTCTMRLKLVNRRPTFYCHGFVGGSSGSPWLVGASTSPEVVGVIGGRHQGGCTEFTSHSPVFGAAVPALVSRAAAGGPGDTPPSAGSDNCPTPTASSTRR